MNFATVTLEWVAMAQTLPPAEKESKPQPPKEKLQCLVDLPSGEYGRWRVILLVDGKAVRCFTNTGNVNDLVYSLLRSSPSMEDAFELHE